LIGSIAQACTDWVLQDVATRFLQIPVAFDEIRLKALLEDVPTTAMTCIEALGIAAVQPMHPSRQLVLTGLDEQVIVGRHQAIRVTLPSERNRSLSELSKKDNAVEIITKE
jgi:hypothetical protein